jgi:large subunit GTPase 1
VTRVGKEADTYIAPNVSAPVPGKSTQDISRKVQVLDQDFFAHNSNLSARPFVRGNNSDGQQFTRSRIYPHQNAVADDGTPLEGGESWLFQNGPVIAAGKKNHKKPKRMKQRSGKGYE